jgi:hypothetical protein
LTIDKLFTSFVKKINLPANENLDRLVAPHLGRPVGRPPKSGIQVKIVDLHLGPDGRVAGLS